MEQSSVPLLVERIDSAEGLRRLQPEWNTLQARSRATSVFLTWEWISTWWEHFGRRRPLWLLVAREPAGRAVGLAPLYLQRARLAPLVGVRALTFIGAGGPVTPDYLDFLADAEHEQAVVEALLAWLREHGREWDVLSLPHVADDSTTMSCLARGGVRAGLWVMQGRPKLSPYATLPARAEEYEGRYLGSKSRKRLREDRKRLSQSGQVSARDLAQECSPAECVALIARLHGSRSVMLGRPSAFERPGYLGFHLQFASLAAERGWLRLWSVLLDGKPIACRYGFAYQGTHYAYQTGFDSEHARLGVGRVVTMECIRGCIEEGLIRFDMLAGDSEDKRHFGKESRWQRTLWLAPADRRGVALPLRLLLPALRQGRAGAVNAE